MQENKKTVCVIDDDEVFQFLCEKTIEKTQRAKKLMLFLNGKEAIDFFNENKNNNESLPDIIFLDIDMPIMDGWQFLEEFLPIKSDIEKRIVIYIVTSSEHPLDVSKAKDITEVKGYVIKPITVENFNNIMDILDL